jgi:hypothetical protein
MPAGNWLAVARTWNTVGTTADSPLLMSTSNDEGQRWTSPVAVRASSTNPAGGLLANGVAYRMYGRPGQFVTFCADGTGKQWGNDVTLVAADADTCANSSDVVLGSDRFMIAYTDYGHRDATGRLRKAVLVREVVVEPPTT